MRSREMKSIRSYNVEAKRRYRAKNRERVRAIARAWRIANREKANAATRRWQSRNKERVKEYNRGYRAANKEKWRAYDRARAAAKRAVNRGTYNSNYRLWARANPEKIAARNRRWVQKYPEKVKARRARRRARTKNGFEATDIIEIRRLQRGRCGYCRSKLKKANEHIDHILALAKGGTNDRNNIQLLCATCNTKKGARDPIAFAQSLGRLI